MPPLCTPLFLWHYRGTNPFEAERCSRLWIERNRKVEYISATDLSWHVSGSFRHIGCIVRDGT